MMFLQAALLSVFPALVIVAALTDITSFTIPNRISVLLFAGFFAAAFALGRPLGEIGVGLGLGVAALLVGMGMFAAGWVGGGDAKLFASAVPWLGLSAMPLFLVATALAGGALAVTLMNVRAAWLRPYFNGGPAWLVRLADPDSAVPYGVAIAIGALAAFPQCALVRAVHGSI